MKRFAIYTKFSYEECIAEQLVCKVWARSENHALRLFVDRYEVYVEGYEARELD